MKLDFNYKKQEIDFTSGYFLKGRHYRTKHIRFKSLYEDAKKGTETVEIYSFEPKKEIKSSCLILHGLGSSNIRFLLWLGPHLASAGVSTNVMILPDNYTRVQDKSTSGANYIYPDIEVLFNIWKHAVIDISSTIDLMEQLNLWKENNIVFGYCLGGMLSVINSAIENLGEKRINHSIFMTTGGNMARIIHQSPSARFARKILTEQTDEKYFLHDREYLYKRYDEDLSIVKNLSFDEILKSDTIHPLMKIDPVTYAQFLDMDKVTFLDAYFDSTLPKISRKYLYDEMQGANRKILPISHLGWLPFSYFMGRYILRKLDMYDKSSKKALIKKETMVNPLDEVE